MRRRGVVTAVDIEAILARKYPAPAFAFMPQLRSSTGYVNAIGTADAVALGLWPSRGLHLHGFEIKVNRGDWMNEVANPAKADVVGKYCDFWWIVAADGVVDIAEVPPTWGCMVVDGRGLRTVREAPAATNPKELDRPFICSILRNIHGAIECLKTGFVAATDVNALVEERVKEEVARRAKVNYETEYEKLQKRVSEFEAASGLDIVRVWSGDKIGDAVKALINADFRQSFAERINWQANGLRSALKDLDAIGKALATEEQPARIA